MADRRTHDQRVECEVANIRAGRLTPRMQQVLDAITAAGEDGISRKEIARALDMSRNNLDHYLYKARRAGLIDNTKASGIVDGARLSRWMLASHDAQADDDGLEVKQRVVRASDAAPLAGATAAARSVFCGWGG